MQVTIYILRCADGSFHTGLTRQDARARAYEHNTDPINSYTARRRPVVLVFEEVYERLMDAIARERQIKGWSRAKKQALIRGDYEALPLCRPVLRGRQRQLLRRKAERRFQAYTTAALMVRCAAQQSLETRVRATHG